MFGRVGVSGFAGHEIEEGIEVDVSSAVGVDNGQYPLEIDLALGKVSKISFFTGRQEIIRFQYSLMASQL